MAICISCGCSDNQACENGCWWVRLSERLNLGVCSSEDCLPHRERFDAGDFSLRFETLTCPECGIPQKVETRIGFEFCQECGHCAHTQRVNGRCALCDAEVPLRKVTS